MPNRPTNMSFSKHKTLEWKPYNYKGRMITCRFDTNNGYSLTRRISMVDGSNSEKVKV